MHPTALIHRISRIQGQLEALKRLLEDSDTHCQEILQLSKTTSRAMQSFTQAFTRYQLEHCLKLHLLPHASSKDITTLIHHMTSL